MVNREPRPFGVPDWGPVGRALVCGATTGALGCAAWSCMIFIVAVFRAHASEANWVETFLRLCGIAVMTSMISFFAILAALCVVGRPIHAVLFANRGTARRSYRIAGFLSGAAVGATMGFALTGIAPQQWVHQMSAPEGTVPFLLVLMGWFASCAILAGGVAADRCLMILRPDLRLNAEGDGSPAHGDRIGRSLRQGFVTNCLGIRQTSRTGTG